MIRRPPRSTRTDTLFPYTTLFRSVVSVAFALAVGVPLGVLAGYAGGWTDTVISRCNEAVLSCPFMILAIAFAAFLGPSLTNAMIAIGLSAAQIGRASCSTSVVSLRFDLGGRRTLKKKITDNEPTMTLHNKNK